MSWPDATLIQLSLVCKWQFMGRGIALTIPEGVAYLGASSDGKGKDDYENKQVQLSMCPVIIQYGLRMDAPPRAESGADAEDPHLAVEPKQHQYELLRRAGAGIF
jgi:hypothetical protein